MILLFRPSREPRADDPHLRIKMIIFALGAAFGLVGIATDAQWFVYIGIVLLAGAFLLRFWRTPDDGA